MEALKPSEVLSRAADLVEPVGAWCQRAFAKDARGQTVLYEGDRACCWCLEGAVMRVAGNRPIPDGTWGAVRYVIDMFTPSGWNDVPGRTQAEVVAALRKASELAKADGQ